MKKFIWSVSVSMGMALAMVSPAQAAKVLLISGASDDPKLLARVLANWDTVCNATGQHEVTTEVAMPSDVADYDQVWDLRWGNNAANLAQELPLLVSALKSGSSVFLMGENTTPSYKPRRLAIASIALAAGGGTITPRSSYDIIPGRYQLVGPPLDTDLTTATTTSAASELRFTNAGTAVPGTDFTGIVAVRNRPNAPANDLSGGSAFVWGRGTLANAPMGKLVTVFDVNFMDNMSFGAYDASSFRMTKEAQQRNTQFFLNLCNYMSIPVPTLTAVDDGSPQTEVQEGASLAFDVLANDVAVADSADPASVTVTQAPAFGSITSIDPTTGQITYAAGMGQFVEDSFTYEVCLKDLDIICQQARVTLRIVPTPVIIPPDVVPPDVKPPVIIPPAVVQPVPANGPWALLAGALSVLGWMFTQRRKLRS